MHVIFKIVRQSPSKPAWVEQYSLDIEASKTILDCLNQIKWEHDGTLAFRKNCRNTICGSCSMRINGRSALACKENVGSEVARLPELSDTDAAPTITVAPMGNMPVIKDLVVDMGGFWSNLAAIDPYVSTRARQVPEREFLQTPEERDQLNQMGNCILCGACYSDCNAREVNPNFVGPHALAKAQRLLVDSRDDQTDARLAHYNQSTDGVWGCTRCHNCNAVCPMEVAPMDQIGQIKQDILHQATKADSRPIRHRKVLVELVKQGGWIDERQFGIQVVGNSFRDWRGLASLGPLGLRMLLRGKFPLGFEPSTGTDTVRSLINAVQALEAEASAPPNPSTPSQE